MTKIRERYLEADVLIIGGGGAGLRAAIEAQNSDANVLLVSKGSFPTGCITAIAMGAMLAHFDAKDSADRHCEDTIKGGDYLNDPVLVRLLVDKAADRVKDLDGYGTGFDKDEGGSYKLFPLTGSSVARGVLAGDRYRGGYFKGLVNEVQRLGIKILEHVMVADLIKRNDTVIGAIGLELDTDSIFVINSKAVILATGGAGNLYSLTTNIPGITGDGYALAYKAGAQLADMEFIQSRACMIFPEAMRGIAPPADGCVTIGGRFYNGLYERYMKKYHPDKGELVTRAEMAKCAQREIIAGRESPHRGVFGDLSGVPKEELSKFKAFLSKCTEEKFDPSWQPYEWAPGTHHFMGGVVTNQKCETGIPGLYTAGEVECGVHGANRLAGNALTETQVFGQIAGQSAAKRALSTKLIPIPQKQLELLRKRIEEILKREKGLDPLEIRNEITEVISLYAGVIRSEDGLRKAIQVLDKIKEEKINSLCLGDKCSFEMLGKLLEVENLLIVGQLVTLSAMTRTETRGAHNREDYPESSSDWLKKIVIELEDNEMKINIIPLKETKL